MRRPARDGVYGGRIYYDGLKTRETHSEVGATDKLEIGMRSTYRKVNSWLLFGLVSVMGCGESAPLGDVGVGDASSLDAGSVDAGDVECGIAVPGRLVCNPDDLEYLYTVDACGNFLEQDTRCFDPKVCEEDAEGQASCRCELTGNLICRGSNTFVNSLYDDTYVVRERECVESSREIDPADIVETCDFGSLCYVDDYDEEEDHVQRNGGQAFCARSVTDDASPYVEFGCDAAFDEFMRYPTTLEVDCRCRTRSVSGSQANGGTVGPADPANIDPETGHPKGAVMNCAQPTAVDRYSWPVVYGDGPVLRDYEDNTETSTWYGAEFDPVRRELYTVVGWGDDTGFTNTASIVAWNVDTKDRRIVSGLFPNSVAGMETFGSGYESPTSFLTDAEGETQPLTGTDAIRLASDGNLYGSSEHEIVRIDPITGARSIVWRRQDDTFTGDITATYGQCFRPSYLGVRDGVQMEQTSFAVGPDFAFYKGFRDVRDGSGVLRISPDGRTCEVIARYNGRGDAAPNPINNVPAPPDVGSGYIPSNIAAQVQGMLVHDGNLYMSIAGDLVALDLSTRVRTRIDDPDLPYITGYTSMYYDPQREVIWTSGSIAAIFGNVVVDPVTGQKEQIVTDNGRTDYPGDAIFRSVYPGGGSAANTGGGATSNNNPTQLGGVIVDPLNPDIAYGVSVIGGLIKLELSTYNNYIHSWGQHL